MVYVYLSHENSSFRVIALFLFTKFPTRRLLPLFPVHARSERFHSIVLSAVLQLSYVLAFLKWIFLAGRLILFRLFNSS
jgi:hypothetical protein